jgi:hypothetical protein
MNPISKQVVYSMLHPCAHGAFDSKNNVVLVEDYLYP